MTLRFDGVAKRYARWPGGERTLRKVLTRRVPLLGRSGHAWALRGVSFEMPAGGSLGVIGRNGAGKSTLLRLAAGLGRPSEGAVEVRGEAAAVLSLGDTFDPTLSGRENALTAALVDGWSGSEARALLPRIVEFSELEEHIDAPVRTYSDGMKMRLAFAVVAQLRPDVLLVDEVLSVGDLAFQAKCAERIAEMRADGTALVLASHDLGLVERECEHALWLERGEPRAYGPAGEVVSAYRDAAHARVVSQTPAAPGLGDTRVGTQQVTIENVAIEAGEGLRLSAQLANHGEPVLDPVFEIRITREHDDLLCLKANSRDAGPGIGRLAGTTGVALVLDRLDLAAGRYLVDVALYSADWDTTFDYHWRAYSLTLGGRPGDRGVLDAPLRWEVSPPQAGGV